MEGSAKEGQPKYWILEDVLLHLNVRELSGTQTDRQTLAATLSYDVMCLIIFISKFLAQDNDFPAF